jgi:hypothetical protein
MQEESPEGEDLASALMRAREQYTVPAEYDEVVLEVADRVRQSGSVGKSDVGALLFWKRLRADTRWVPRLMALSDADVRAVTANAVSAVNDASLSHAEAAARGRRELAGLPGFANGDALASAVLFAAAPRRMAVYDRRAHKGLQALTGVDVGRAPGRYGRYMRAVAELVATVNAENPAAQWRPRDVDLALYSLGAPPEGEPGASAES